MAYANSSLLWIEYYYYFHAKKNGNERKIQPAKAFPLHSFRNDKREQQFCRLREREREIINTFTFIRYGRRSKCCFVQCISAQLLHLLIFFFLIHALPNISHTSCRSQLICWKCCAVACSYRKLFISKLSYVTFHFSFALFVCLLLLILHDYVVRWVRLFLLLSSYKQAERRTTFHFSARYELREMAKLRHSQTDQSVDDGRMTCKSSSSYAVCGAASLTFNFSCLLRSDKKTMVRTAIDSVGSSAGMSCLMAISFP